MLKIEKNIDVVSICTESGNHFNHAMIANKYKKNVIIEKPISLDFLEAKKLKKEFLKIKKKIFVVMQNRFNPPIVYLKKFLDKKKFGVISSVSVNVWWCRDQNYFNQAKWRGTWDMDGGVLSNQAIHHIDMLIWLLGDPVRVFGLIKRKFAKIEAEDYASAIVQFKSGVTAVVETSNAIRPKNLEGSITIHGSKGSAKIGGNAMNRIDIWIDKKNGLNNKKVISRFQNNNKDVYGKGHIDFYLNAFKAFKSKSNFIDANEGRKSIELVNAIYISSYLEKPLNLPLKINYKKIKERLKNEF